MLRAEAPQLRFAGLGGATETAVHNTFSRSATPTNCRRLTAVPFGTPLPNNACRVVNDMGADCPDWVVGELWVSGRGIARGYRGRPDLTAERFVEYDGRNWYRTGDLARYWPDGAYWSSSDAADHRVKSAATASNSVRSRPRCGRYPGVAIAVAALVPTTGRRRMLAAAIRADDTQLTAGGRARSDGRIVFPRT